jgi:DNA-binding GntR family transcriptional regulator
MMRPGTFERVYAAIKEQLRSGRFRPGRRLEPAVLSDELNASVTPVRDALHRLTGERLVEAPRQEGFRVPLLTESSLRHLYRWHQDLLLMAIASHQTFEQASEATHDQGPGEAYLRRNSIFLGFARATGNPEHVLALEGLIERLGPLQRFESGLLDALEEETTEIVEAIASQDRRALRAALLRYHRRRMRIVPDLLDQLYASAD